RSSDLGPRGDVAHRSLPARPHARGRGGQL
ncbi:MAG: hypothetical protein AVDCRST_MAG78-217, partial [uncultured Rubrobacteraceae bacterium]